MVIVCLLDDVRWDFIEPRWMTSNRILEAASKFATLETKHLKGAPLGNIEEYDGFNQVKEDHQVTFAYQMFWSLPA